jgi:hypothetical protein
MSKIVNMLDVIRIPAKPRLGKRCCQTCCEVFEPVSDNSKFCSQACDKQKTQKEFASNQQRHVSNKCFQCGDNVVNVCTLSHVFCSAYCIENFTHM